MVMRVTKLPLMNRLLGLALSLTLIVTLATLGALPRTQAAAKTLAVGITLPLTGADAEDAELIKDGAVLAIEEANARGGVAGYKIEMIILDSGTATAGQYDPAQAATNTKKLVANVGVVANIGPQMSGEGKAMSQILSEADMATITPSSTNPDITDPQYKDKYRPKGGSDGMYSASLLKGAGFPSSDGWYATIASPHLVESAEIQDWVKRFAKRFGKQPGDYSITAYDAGLVILDAIKRVAASGKPVDRHTVRDAIQNGTVRTLQGPVSFDENGDIKDRTVSVFQVG